MNKRHIVQVSAYYPPHLGGQENAVHDLAHELFKAGHPVHVLTSTEGGGPRGTVVEDGVRVSRFPGFVFGHAPIMLGLATGLWRAINSDSIVHLHIGQAFTPEVVWLISRLRKFKYVAQLHIDFKPSGPAGILLPLYKKFILKRVLAAASAVIVLNEETLTIVRDVYGYKGILRIIDNGIDESYFALKRKALTSKPPASVRLLFVGRLSQQKNLPILLNAIQLTKRNVHLDIIGEGDQGRLVQQLIEDYELKNVTLHGRLSREAIKKFYETSDALIMPSLYEAQPLVLLEAMASRIPIIGTNVIGVAEHIRDGGIVAEPTVKGLLRGIGFYFNNYAKLPHMVKSSYSRADSMRWSRTLKKYELLYEEVSKD